MTATATNAAGSRRRAASAAARGLLLPPQAEFWLGELDHTGSFRAQLGSVAGRILRHALPSAAAA